MIPGLLELVLMTLGAYRATRLIGWDTFPPVEAVRLRVASRSDLAAELLGCPFCLGWWVSLTVYVLWVAFPTVTVTACVPLAVSASVGLIARNLDP